MAAPIWSAIAACFSAFAAFIMWRILRTNMLDAAKPEIVLSEWKRKKVLVGKQKNEYLCFKSIKNIGRGPALHVYITSSKMYKNRPQASLSPRHLSILPAGEEHEIEGNILIYWQNVPEKKSLKSLSIDVEVSCWCSKNYRHKTLYTMPVIKEVESQIDLGSEQIAPGVTMPTRSTTRMHVLLLKLYSKLSKIPYINKFIPKV